MPPPPCLAGTQSVDHAHLGLGAKARCPPGGWHLQCKGLGLGVLSCGRGHFQKVDVGYSQGMAKGHADIREMGQRGSCGAGRHQG